MRILLALIILFYTVDLFSANSGITLKDINNKEINLDDYIGKKVVILNFWATWCSPCKKELPVLDKLYKKYRDKNFTVLSVSLDDSSEFSAVRSFVTSNKLSLKVLLDPDGECSDYYNPSKNAPYSILFDSSGKVIKKYLGFNSGDEEEIENLVSSLIKEKNENKNSVEYRFLNKTVYIRYDPDADNEVFKNYEFLLTRTNLFGAFSRYSLSTSFYTENFLTETNYLRSMNYKFSDYRLEKITFKANFKHQKVLVGDYHITQGKGIALSLTKKDDLGIDTTLRGSKIALKYKMFNVKIFGGLVNNVNHNPDNNMIYKDKNDLILGGDIDFVLLKNNLIFSLNYNKIMFKMPEFIKDENQKSLKPKDFSRETLQVIGGHVSYKYKKIMDTYFEADTIIDGLYKKNRRLNDPLALYGSLSYNFGKFTVLHEFKRYRDFMIGFKNDISTINIMDESGRLLIDDNSVVREGIDTVYYNNLPTLEKKGEKVYDQGEDIWGVRTKIYYKYSENIKPYFNYLYSKSYALHNRITNHVYTGSEFYFNDKKSKIDFYLTLRLEHQDYDERVQSDETENYYGANFDVSLFISSNLSLDLKGFFHQTEKSINTEGTDDFQDIEATVSMGLWKSFFISYLYNKYNLKGSKETDFHAVELKYKYKDYFYTKLFYGSVRGGQKCIGGVCKDYPSFKGAKITFVFSF